VLNNVLRASSSQISQGFKRFSGPPYVPEWEICIRKMNSPLCQRGELNASNRELAYSSETIDTTEDGSNGELIEYAQILYNVMKVKDGKRQRTFRMTP
jgi:hypothetical protein